MEMLTSSTNNLLKIQMLLLEELSRIQITFVRMGSNLLVTFKASYERLETALINFTFFLNLVLPLLIIMYLKIVNTPMA